MCNYSIHIYISLNYFIFNLINIHIKISSFAIFYNRNRGKIEASKQDTSLKLYLSLY